jgi:hypothetical protein
MAQGCSLSMSAQNAVAQLLYKIVGGVIPQSAKKQGIPASASSGIRSEVGAVKLKIQAGS